MPSRPLSLPMQPSLRPSAALGRQPAPSAAVTVQSSPPASFPAVLGYPSQSVSFAPRGGGSSSRPSPVAPTSVAALNGGLGSVDVSALSGLASLHLTDTQLSALSASLKLNPYQQLALQQLTQQQRSAAAVPPSTAAAAGGGSGSSGSSGIGHSAASLPSARSPPPLPTAVDVANSVVPVASSRSAVSSPPSASPPLATATAAPPPRPSSRTHPVPVNSSDLAFPSSSGGSSPAVPPPGSEAARTQAKALLKSAHTITHSLILHCRPPVVSAESSQGRPDTERS